MIRVKIRHEDSDGNGGEGGARRIGKVLRFDESIEFSALIRKIIDKLGVNNIDDHANVDDTISTLFQLRLGGDSIIEETNEIEHGDDLVLVRISANDSNENTLNNRQGSSTNSSSSSSSSSNISNNNDILKTETSSSSSSSLPPPAAEPIKKEHDAGNSAEEAEDHEAILISSDDNEDDESFEDDDEGSAGCWDLDTDCDDNDKAEDDSATASVDDDDDDYVDHSQQPSNKKRQPKSSISKKKKQAQPEPPLEVIMNQKDVPSSPGKNDDDDDDANQKDKNNIGMREVSLLVGKAGKTKSDRAVKDRIIKLLNTGFHDASNENEAKNAMKLAQRLMKKHNLSQIMLLKEREEKNHNLNAHDDDEVLKGGMVRVTILNRKTRKPSLFARWIAKLLKPVCDNFEVKSFKQIRRSVRCDVVFYGIYSNAQLAAYAFKVAAERISQMTAEYDPSTTVDRCTTNLNSTEMFLSAPNTTTGGGKRRKNNYKTISTKSSRLSYALGVVKGICEDVQRHIELEKEERESKLERARSARKKGEAYEDSDDDDNDDKTGCGFSFHINGNDDSYSDIGNNSNDSQHDAKQERDDKKNEQGGDYSNDKKATTATSLISGMNLDRRVEELEKQHQAALVLINHNEKIAKEVLEEHNIKVTSGRKRKAIDVDQDSYDKGIEDSKEIDMNQRAIRDEIKVKKECV